MDEGIIRSRSNPLVRRLRALKEKAGGELMLLEGPKLIEEALASSIGVVEAAASPRLAGIHAGVVETLRRRGVAVRLVDEGVLASLSELETSQGILALARRPAFDEARLFEGTPLVLVAAGIQNPGNLGALRYDEADLRHPVAILLGPEGAGLAPAARSRAAASVAIPMARGVDSLNVSVAAGVLLFEAARQRRFRSALVSG